MPLIARYSSPSRKGVFYILIILLNSLKKTGGLIQAAAVVTGFTNWTFTIIGIATIAFFFATWETYFTGTMFLGTINGPTEGLLISIATILISGIYGPMVWKLKLVPTVLPMSYLKLMPLALQPTLSRLTTSQAAIYAMVLMLVTIQVPPCIYRAFKACSQKKRGFSTAILTAVQFLVLVFFATAWILAPGSTLTSDHVIVFSLAWGIAVGKINVRLFFIES
jgi:ethanolaminephosphotransferase